MHDPLVVAFRIRRPWPEKFHGILEGRRYWPSLITVWHREPRGHDSGEMCKRYRQRDGEWPLKYLNGWRFHVWHWRIRVEPLQHFRRWLLTRCAWCGGRSRNGDRVNISHQRDGARGHWWQGEPGLFHGECSPVERAHSLCFCVVPVLSHGDYGQCEACGGFRAWRSVPDKADRLLASLPEGSRITPEIRPQVEAAWAERRARKVA